MQGWATRYWLQLGCWLLKCRPILQTHLATKSRRRRWRDRYCVVCPLPTRARPASTRITRCVICPCIILYQIINSVLYKCLESLQSCYSLMICIERYVNKSSNKSGIKLSAYCYVYGSNKHVPSDLQKYALRYHL